VDSTILLGLDGATYKVLDPLIADGHMPHLRKILADGVRAELLSTPHPLTPPAWTTVMTGRSPGNHGIFDFLRTDVHPEGTVFSLMSFRDVRCETIWSIVSRLGGRVTVLNYPMTAPPPPVNGVVVPGTLSWRHLRRHVYPAGLYEELKALPGFNARELSWDFENEKAIQSMPEEEFEPWVRFHTVREKGWFNVLRHVMTAHPADLTAIVFDGVDKLQHGCWRFLDPDLIPAQPNALERRLRDHCLEYFQQLDGFVGEILAANPRARVLVVSDHGFGPSMRRFRVNKWLEQQGYLRWQNRPAPGDGAEPGAHQRWDKQFVAFDPEHTTAFAPSLATNGIHIRVKQRPGDHGIDPQDYSAFRARLVEQLRRIPDPLQPEVPLLADVLTREQAFPGEHPERAPDLTLVLRDHGLISIVNAEPAADIRPNPIGTHYPAGILVGYGPGFRSGVKIGRQSIIDVAPTLLHSLGLPIPLDFEGRAVSDLFDPDFLANHPIRVGAATQSPDAAAATTSSGMAKGEEAVILDRLRALGYVE
jgi:predicted AlkP superfamily phosphohydrolase/phosphomutase